MTNASTKGGPPDGEALGSFAFAPCGACVHIATICRDGALCRPGVLVSGKLNELDHTKKGRERMNAMDILQPLGIVLGVIVVVAVVYFVGTAIKGRREERRGGSHRR